MQRIHSPAPATPSLRVAGLVSTLSLVALNAQEGSLPPNPPPVGDIEGQPLFERLSDLRAVDDLDGDGYSDVLIGDELWREGDRILGRILILSGRDGSLLREAGGEPEGERFGHRVALIDDLDGDGKRDYAVSNYGGVSRPANETRPHDHIGLVTCFSLATGKKLREIWSEQPAGSGFGASLCGVMGWGRNESALLIGAADYLYGHWGPDGPVLEEYSLEVDCWPRKWAPDPFFEPKSTEDDVCYGNLAAALDLNGDSITDFIIGAPRWSSSGRLFAYNGFNKELLYSFEGDPGTELGQAIEVLPDLDLDGTRDYAVSALHYYVDVVSGATGERIARLTTFGTGVMDGFGQTLSCVDEYLFVGTNEFMPVDSGARNAAYYAGWNLDGFELLGQWYIDEPARITTVEGQGGDHLVVLGLLDSGRIEARAMDGSQRWAFQLED